MSSDVVYKVLVLGEPSTGKTSLIKRYCHDLFSSHHKTTIGVDFALKHLPLDGTRVCLQLWDVAGQDRFASVQRVYYRDAVGAVLVFDASRHDTLDLLLQWKFEIDEKVRLPNHDPIPIVLIGNKSDLAEAEYDKEQLDIFCAKNRIHAWFPVSAKRDINVEESFVCLAKAIAAVHDLFDGILITDEDQLDTNSAYLGDFGHDSECFC